MDKAGRGKTAKTTMQHDPLRGDGTEITPCSVTVFLDLDHHPNLPSAFQLDLDLVGVMLFFYICSTETYDKQDPIRLPGPPSFYSRQLLGRGSGRHFGPGLPIRSFLRNSRSILPAVFPFDMVAPVRGLCGSTGHENGWSRCPVNVLSLRGGFNGPSGQPIPK